MPLVRTNYLQTPNKAFEVLTNDNDLVGYQKLLRTVGVGNVWEKGNRALARQLGMSYGKLVRLKQVLQKAGFIEIVSGDNFHGEADKLKMVDIFDYKAVEDTLSKSGQPLSTNGQPLSKSGQVIRNNNSVPNGTGETPSKDSSLSETSETPVGRRVWKDGVDLLMKDGKSKREAKSFLGMLAKKYSNELLAECIAVTEAKNPAEIESFLIAVLQTRSARENPRAAAPKVTAEALNQAEADFLAELKFNNGASANV